MNLKSKFIYGNKTQKVFEIAKERKFALPAINVSGTNTINAVLETASDLNSSVIIQFSHGGAHFIAGKVLTTQIIMHQFLVQFLVLIIYTMFVIIINRK